MAPTSPVFTRDRFTWLAYLGLAYFAYFQAALGPLMPFLRDELNLNYTEAGFHISSFAFGMMVAGTTGDLVAAKWGRYRTFWGGGIGMAIGIILFSLGQSLVVTIFSTFLMGSLGSLVLVMVQSTLSDRHSNNRAIALTEANIMASVSASLAPFLIGGFEGIGIGWRGGILIAIVWWGSMIAWFRHEPLPKMQQESNAETHSKSPRKLPSIFWLFWIIVFLGVSVEWSIVFWGADFLDADVGLNRETAATLMSVFFVASIIGRIIGNRLTHRFPITILLLGALVISIIGFLLYWQSPVKAFNIIGLFVTGIGVANLFPLCLSISSTVVTHAQSDIASGRISLGAGTAILIAPQLLGIVADKSSIRTAYLLVMILLILATMMTILAYRKTRNL